MAAMITHSGRMVDLLNVRPEDIDLDDIAHALAHTCRFAGHTKRHYSVAEHSLNVARLLPEPIKIYGLLHDAHEAYIGDISTPLKRALEHQIGDDLVDDGWEADFSFLRTLASIERQIDAAIYAALKVPPPGTLVRDAVKWADNTMALKEMRELFDTPPPAGEWGIDETLPVPDWGLGDAAHSASEWAGSFKYLVRCWIAR